MPGSSNDNFRDQPRQNETTQDNTTTNERPQSSSSLNKNDGNQSQPPQAVYQLPPGGYYQFSSSGQAAYTLMGDERWGGTSFAPMNANNPNVYPPPPPRMAHMNQSHQSQYPGNRQQRFDPHHHRGTSGLVGPGGDFVQGSHLREAALPPGYGLLHNPYNYILESNLGPSSWPNHGASATFFPTPQPPRPAFRAPSGLADRDTNSDHVMPNGESSSSSHSQNGAAPGRSMVRQPMAGHQQLIMPLQPPLASDPFRFSGLPATHDSTQTPEPRTYHSASFRESSQFSVVNSIGNVSQTLSGISLSSSLAGSHQNSPRGNRNGQNRSPVEQQAEQETHALPDNAPPDGGGKALTWAEKVKQSSKDLGPKVIKPKVPIGGVGSRSKTSAGQSGPMGSSSTSVNPGSLIAQWGAKSFAPATAKSDHGVLGTSVRDNQFVPPAGAITVGASGWGKVGGGGKVVSARKPAAAPPAPNPSTTPDAKSNERIENRKVESESKNRPQLGPPPPEPSAQQKRLKGIKASDSDALQKLKLETNPPELNAANTKGARYFVIKSYSEDDVHRSIKYGIWCSTPVGNRRLDSAFRTNSGPILLFFSVNASGHFCGVARMTSEVDYGTQSQVWVQGKWKGLFHVQWLYVKDVPNGHLRHIRLENNEDKPVTNSRDTQEVPPEKGRILLRSMHQFKHSTSLFDDFSHYEQRQLEEESMRTAANPRHNS